MKTTDTPIKYTPQAPVWPEIVRLQGKIAELEKALSESQADVKRLRKEIILREDMDNVAQEAWDEMKAEIKEIRAALGDDGRRTHKEILELATKASQWREWKKKYIDLEIAHMAVRQDLAGTIWEHAGKLQKELAKSKAEIDRLKEMVKEAARKGDELLEPYRLRAEKAETLIKQIYAFVEALNKTDK